MDVQKMRPWEVVSLSGISGPFAIRMAYNDEKTFYGIRQIYRREDAALTSSAPDLLRALEDILPSAGWANYSDEELLDEAAKGNETAPRILNARAAIAKARST